MSLAAHLPAKESIEVGYRKLWCEVIRQAYDANHLEFFESNMFHYVCALMGIDAHKIESIVRCRRMAREIL